MNTPIRPASRRVRWACVSFIASLAMLTHAGCADDPVEGPPIGPPPDREPLLPPPNPGEGVQFTMKTQIPAGAEAEHCMFVKAPAEGMYVAQDEVRYTPGSHHMLLYATSYTEIPSHKDDGTPVDTSGVFDCTSGPTQGWSITKLVGGSQNVTGESMLAFPPGVAIRIEPGAVLLMNAHYINASFEPLEPEVFINLYAIPEDEVEVEGDIMFFYNPLIKVPAGSSARARMRCLVYEDITLVNVQSHMHARGVDYAANIDGQEPFYVNDRWSEVPVADFLADGGIEIPAGSTLDYYCDYQNSEQRDVYQGPRSTDEMCMLIGSYYPANSELGRCLAETGDRYVAEWVGTGTATCAETLGCVLEALGAPGDPVPGLTDCMMAADPEVATESSAALNCIMSAADPATECAEPFAACQAR